MKLTRLAGLLAVALTVGSGAANAAGNYSTYPIIGYPAFCDSIVTGSGGFTVPQGNTGGGGVTGQGQASSTAVCAQTIPAGPPTFSGLELLPLDTGLPGGASPQSATVNVNQLGQGVVVDSVASGAALTIPANSQFFVLDTGTAATVAVTMPAVAEEGQIQHLLCAAAVGTALSVVANTGQTIKGASPTTCTAGQGFAWRFVASANGIIVANSWLRIQ